MSKKNIIEVEEVFNSKSEEEKISKLEELLISIIKKGENIGS